jgi:hypothetical protein
LISFGINLVDNLIINKVKYKVIPIGINATIPAIKLFLSLVKMDFLIVFLDIILLSRLKKQ